AFLLTLWSPERILAGSREPVFSDAPLPLSRPDPQGILYGRDEYPAVTFLARHGSLPYGGDYPVHILVVGDDLDLRLGEELRLVLLPPELLLHAFLPPLSLDLVDHEAGAADPSQGLVDVARLCGTDYGLYLLHAILLVVMTLPLRSLSRRCVCAWRQRHRSRRSCRPPPGRCGLPHP